MPSDDWEKALERLRTELDTEEFRRWFGPTAYASDAGDQISVWVPTETDRRHLQTHYADTVERAFAAVGRRNTHIRFLVSGVGEDDDPGD